MRNSHARKFEPCSKLSHAHIARSSVSAVWFTTAAFYPEQTAQTVYKLKAGDYVEVWVAQDSGSALDLMVGVDNGVTYSMQWLAP